MGKQKVFIRKKIKKGPYILLYSYMLVVLLVCSTVASYAWFTLSMTPQVSNLNVYITSGAGLELSATPDAEVWTNQLDIFSTKELSGLKGEKRPSLRQATWSKRDQCFYGPLYGYDGRLMTFSEVDYDKLEIISWYPLNDEINANKLSPSSYYMKATLYARTGQPTDVNLAEPMWLDTEQTVKGAGSYLVGDPNTGHGPETAVRMGFRMTYVDSGGNPLGETSPMYVYEPNADRHVDGSTEYIPTYSVDEFRPRGDDDPTEEPENWFLVEEEQLIKQSFSRSASEPGDFITNPTLFSIKPGEIVRIELYIWLEGQDVDCSNAMSDGVTTTKINANIQFTGTTETQSGMVPIE